MTRKKRLYIILGINILCLLLLFFLRTGQNLLNLASDAVSTHTYFTLPANEDESDPLQYISEDFTVEDGFYSNLPIVILNLDGEITNYKSFRNEEEIVDESVEEWTTGSIQILKAETGYTHLSDTPQNQSKIEIKKRGHTSFSFDKSQYRINLIHTDGTENSLDILGMGSENSWILNGSMADKSMLRNYLGYRIASEIMESSPDSQYCEVIFKEDGTYRYQGLYLLQESVSRSPDRVNIDSYKPKNVYSSYIIRRDRFTNFDIMLETYGRVNQISPQWIGLKYPSDEKITDETKKFIENDFSKIEKIIYSDKKPIFKTYSRYIDIDSFVDYFLVNEFFGNYDAGEHSTYMYKNSGERLQIGPVWDFDQAMNNYYQTEMDPETLAFYEKPLFDHLCKDKRFINLLKKRYAKLRKSSFSEAHVISVIDETTSYLSSARRREWYRWAADYEDDSFLNPHNYYLQDFIKDNVIINRFNDSYNQEIYNIKTYLRKHGKIMQVELSKLYRLTETDSSIKDEKELILVVVLLLFFVPAILINRKK
ncbi:CotH kinase family protein [Sinanaerobacter sp. ZZT-01]|uniref:CotH kinase family protein n=1 Tax=Sinanaerobacter sp. ZZT-01 TaxID=3111540 RepID=UPI002D76BDB3|nr:CotH kinase family protein [Sinanaerobacter sp. ZZT-01]WRR94954.1 CotH kinase family protein [Sinanaerobacter sp. ZZT-01]